MVPSSKQSHVLVRGSPVKTSIAVPLKLPVCVGVESSEFDPDAIGVLLISESLQLMTNRMAKPQRSFPQNKRKKEKIC